MAIEIIRDEYVDIGLEYSWKFQDYYAEITLFVNGKLICTVLFDYSLVTFLLNFIRFEHAKPIILKKLNHSRGRAYGDRSQSSWS